MTSIAKNIQAIDVKPKDISVVDTKPKDISVMGETKIYLDNRTFARGQIIPWGGFAITYPVAGTWLNATRL